MPKLVLVRGQKATKEGIAISRFVDYYAILNVSATASLEEIERALAAAFERLQGNGMLEPADRDEQSRMLSRARTVLCDEQNRMMYDILGKDITTDEIPVEQSKPSTPAVSAQAPVLSEPQPAPDNPTVESVADRPKTQSELDAEMAYKRLCAELDLKAERLQRMEVEEKKSFRHTTMGRIVIASLIITAVSSLVSFVVSLFLH